MRTLHHYDAIGLLKPTKLTEAGYRMYDDAAISRLQSILAAAKRCAKNSVITIIADTNNT